MGFWCEAGEIGVCGRFVQKSVYQVYRGIYRNKKFCIASLYLNDFESKLFVSKANDA